MLKAALIAVRVTFFTLLLTGVAYPLVVTGLAQLLFSRQANGSLVRDNQGHIIGSELIGQRFSRPAYFQPRPSGAGESGYEPTASGGSNLGPTSQKLRDRAIKELENLQKENPDAAFPVPAELVTASASGLDPHLSLAGALWQVPRVARARGIAAERIKAVVQLHLQGPDLGFVGKPRVNVLLLNLALDRQFGTP